MTHVNLVTDQWSWVLVVYVTSLIIVSWGRNPDVCLELGLELKSTLQEMVFITDDRRGWSKYRDIYSEKI